MLLLASLLAVAHYAQPVVCIDPGHPSEVGVGTQGRKLTELHANWTEAVLLKQRLQKRGIKVVMTKAFEKQFVRNRARAEVANKAHADLMVRLHCDAASGTGFTSYYPTRQGLAEGVRGPSQWVLAASRKKAIIFHQALSEAMKGRLKDNGLMSDLKTAVGGKQGALTGSVFSKVPVVLVEMIVLTNRKDEAFLSGKVGQEAMADALTAAVLAALRV